MHQRQASNPLAERSFERILLIKPSSLGDIVHALPVLRGLRVRYPSARIDWLIASPFAALIQGHPDLNHVIIFDRKRFGGILTDRGAASDLWRFLRELRVTRYDLVVDLQGLLRTGLLSAVTGASVRVGFREAREGAWWFYTHRIAASPVNTHAVDRNLRYAQALGFDAATASFDLALNDTDRAGARRLLDANGVFPHKPWLAIVPGARWETKTWSKEHFVQLINELHALGACRCVLIGGPDETAICQRIRERCLTAPTDLSGRSDVRTFAALISLADAVLCHDSAALHLAVALNRPLVCLTGPTNPHRTGPYQRLSDVLRLDLPCSPCYFRKLSQCPYNHKCMRDLNPAMVITAVRQALGPLSLTRNE